MIWALIPCSKSKLEAPCRADEMYLPSALFRGALATARSRVETPLILSAKYGLLYPHQVIAPYNETLIGKPLVERLAWSVKVLEALLPNLQPGDRFASYLGGVYGETIIPALRQRGHAVDEPLKGLGQGKRLAWFKANSA